MRFHYYMFPEHTDPQTLLQEGCGVILKNGSTIWPETIPEDKWNSIDRIDTVLYGISIKHAKKLLKTYGGSAWTEHYDRNGSLFESTPITLKGNNSRFQYNRHL